MAEKEPDKKRSRTPRKNPTPRKRPCVYDESAPYSSPEDGEELQKQSTRTAPSKGLQGVRSLVELFNSHSDTTSSVRTSSGSPAINTRCVVADPQRRSPRKKSTGRTATESPQSEGKSTPKSKSKKKSKKQKHAEMLKEIAKVKQRLAELKGHQSENEEAKTTDEITPEKVVTLEDAQEVDIEKEIALSAEKNGSRVKAIVGKKVPEIEPMLAGIESKEEAEAIEVLSTLSERVSEVECCKIEENPGKECSMDLTVQECKVDLKVKKVESEMGLGILETDAVCESGFEKSAGRSASEVRLVNVHCEPASTYDEDIVMAETNLQDAKPLSCDQEQSVDIPITASPGGDKTGTGKQRTQRLSKKKDPSNSQVRKSPHKKSPQITNLDVNTSIVDQILPRLTQSMKSAPAMEVLDLSKPTKVHSDQKQSRANVGVSRKKLSPKNMLSTWKSPDAPKSPRAPASVVTALVMRSSVEKVKRRVRFSPDKAVRAARARLTIDSARSESSTCSEVLPAGNGDVEWVDADILPLQDDDDDSSSIGATSNDLSPKSRHDSRKNGSPKSKNRKKSVKKKPVTPPSPGRSTVRTSRRLAIKKESKMLKNKDMKPKIKQKGKAIKADQTVKCDNSVVKSGPAAGSGPLMGGSKSHDHVGNTTCSVISKDSDAGSPEMLSAESLTSGGDDFSPEVPARKAKRGQKRKGAQKKEKQKGDAKRRKCQVKPSPTFMVEQMGQLSANPSSSGLRAAVMSPVKDEGALAAGYDLHVSDSEMDSPTKSLHNLSQIILGLNKDSRISPPASSTTTLPHANPKVSTTPTKKTPVTPKKTPLKVSFRFRTPTKTPPRLTPGRMGSGARSQGALSVRSPARFVGRFSPQVQTSQLSFQEESGPLGSSSNKLPLPPKVGRVTCSAIEVLDTQALNPSQPVASTSTSGTDQPEVVSVTPSPRRRPARRSLNLGRSIAKKKSPPFKLRSKDSEKSGTSDEREADPLSPEETVDSPHDRLKIVEVDEEDDGDDQWEDEELNDQIDKEANSQSIRLTARNVKTIIKEVITNEHVLDMVRNTLLEEGLEDQLKEAIFEPRMTRGIVKKAMEKGKIPTLWPITPTKGTNPQAPTLIDIEFPEDEEDEDYNPLNDQESDVDSESIVSSRASDFGSPRSQLATPTPSSPTTPATLRKIPEDAETSSTTNDEPPLSHRLRSKMSLTDTPLEQIEASFVAPDITPDLYNKVEANTRNEKDWQVFLASLTTTTEPELNDTYDENNDPEYNFLEETEPIDSEEQRNDKGVKVTKKELTELMDELFDAYQDCLDEDTKGDLPLNALVGSMTASPAKTAYKPKMPQMTTNTPASFLVVHGVQDFIKEHDYILDSVRGSSVGADEDGPTADKGEDIPKITPDELIQLQDQTRKHVQLLAQTFILAKGDEKYNGVAEQATNLLGELNVLGSVHMKTKGTVSVFHPINLAQTLHLVQSGLPESETNNLQNYVWKTLKKKGWKRALGPPEKLGLTWRQMEFFVSSEIFLFPQMLPETRFFEREKKPAYTIFSEAEDNLLCLGVAQFENLGSRAEVAELIRTYMMPTKNERQISLRLKRLRGKETPDNPMKELIKTKKLPEFERYLTLEAPEDICAPEDRDPELMPFWFKIYEKVKNDYKEGKIPLEMDPETSRCSTPESLLDDSALSTVDGETAHLQSSAPCQSRKPLVRGGDKKTSTPRCKGAGRPPLAALSPLVTSAPSVTVNSDKTTTVTAPEPQSLLVASPGPSSSGQPVTQYIILTNTANGLEASPAPSVPPGTQTTNEVTEPGTPTPVIIMSSAELQQYGAQMINTLAVAPTTPTVSISSEGMQVARTESTSSLIPLVGSVQNGDIVASPAANLIQTTQTSGMDMTDSHNVVTSFSPATTSLNPQNMTSLDPQSVMSPVPCGTSSDVHDVIMSPALEPLTLLPPQIVTSQNENMTSPAPAATPSQTQNTVMSPAPQIPTSYGSKQELVTSAQLGSGQNSVTVEEPRIGTPSTLPLPFPVQQPSPQVLSNTPGTQTHLLPTPIMSPAVVSTPTQSTNPTTIGQSLCSPVPVVDHTMNSPLSVPQSSTQLIDTKHVDSPPTFKTPSKSSFITPNKDRVAGGVDTPPSKLLSPANLLLTGGSHMDSPDIDSCQLHLEADHPSFNTSTEKSFDDSDTSTFIMNTPQKFVPNEELSCSPSAYSDRSNYTNSPVFSDKSLDTPTKSAVEIMAAMAEYLSPSSTKGRSPSKFACSTPSPKKRLTPSKSWLSPSSSRPLPTTPIRFRTIQPKPGPQTPPKPMSPIGKKKSKSPRRKILQQKARAILPKGFVASTYAISPTKKAAANLTRRARTRSGLRKILPKAEVRKLDLGGDVAAEPTADDNEDTDIDVVETDFASEYDTLDSEYASEENQSADEKENNAKALIPKPESAPPAKAKRQRRWKKKEKKETEYNDSGSEDDGFGFGLRLGADSQDEGEEDDPFAQFMAASTTIRFDPKSRSALDRQTNKSKTKAKREMTLHMLAPDVVGGDVMRDERDTAFAQAFLTHVKDRLKDDKGKLEAFIKTLSEFGLSDRTPVQLHQEVHKLLAEYPDVTEDFAGFLLPEQARQVGCFSANMEFGRARTFMRKLEVFFGKHPSHLQKIFKALSSWKKGKTCDREELRKVIVPLLRGQQHLIDEFTRLFSSDKPPTDHTDDYEEITIGEDEDSGDLASPGSSMEEVSLPEATDDALYGTSRCRCRCHAVSDKLYVRRKQHCHSCSMKIIRGKLYMQTMEKTLRPVQVQFLGPTPRQTAVSAPGEEEEGAKDDALSSDDDNFQDPLVDTANDAKKSKPARKRATKSRAKAKPAEPKPSADPQPTHSQVVAKEPAETAETSSIINITEDSMLPSHNSAPTSDTQPQPTDFSILRTELRASSAEDQPELTPPERVENHVETAEKEDIEEEEIKGKRTVVRIPSPPNCEVMCESTQTGAVLCRSGPLMRVASKDIRMTQVQSDSDNSSSSNSNSQESSSNHSQNQTSTSSNSTGTDGGGGSNQPPAPEDSQSQFPMASCMVRGPPGVLLNDEAANMGQHAGSNTASTSKNEPIVLRINLNSEASSASKVVMAESNGDCLEASQSSQSFLHDDATMGFSVAAISVPDREEVSRESCGPKTSSGTSMDTGESCAHSAHSETVIDQLDGNSNEPMDTSDIDVCDHDVDRRPQSPMTSANPQSQTAPTARSYQTDVDISEGPTHPEPADKTDWTKDEDKEILLTCQQLGPTVDAFRTISNKLASRPTIEQVSCRFSSLMSMFDDTEGGSSSDEDEDAAN